MNEMYPETENANDIYSEFYFHFGVKCDKLLKTTQISIIDIARMSGFNNISNFNRTFKIYYKLTPSKFRKKEMQALGIELEK